MTLTATDPGELTAERAIDVEVLEPVLIFRDDFDSHNFAWVFHFSARFRYRDGLLHLGGDGWALRWVGDLAEWEYTASVGVEEGAEAECSVVGLASRHDTYIGWAGFEEGAYDVGVALLDGSGSLVTEQGSSDAVRVVGEFTEMVWTSRFGVMTLAAGETVLARRDHELFAPSSPELMERAGMAYLCGDSDKSALYDWAELWAVEAGGGS